MARLSTRCIPPSAQTFGRSSGRGRLVAEGDSRNRNTVFPVSPIPEIRL